jgi:hypothetical protein
MSIYDKASLVLIPSGTKTSKVYSQKPTNGDGDFTFSRSTAATRVNASGSIEKETQNFALQSNSFSTSPWSLQASASLTSGQAGYDGTNNAWLLSKAADYSRLEQNIVLSGVWTFSCYAKAGTLDWVSFENSGIAGDTTFFNLNSGTLGTLGSGCIDSSIEDVGSGWYRCSVTISGTSAIMRIQPSVSNGVANGSNGNIYIQDAQLEQGLVARDYIETTTTAIYGGITDNVPRLDYQGSCPALLLEPQRTNIVPISEGVPESTNEVVLTENYGTSPEGVTNSLKVQKNGVTSNDRIYPIGNYNAVLVSGQEYSISAFVKNIDVTGVTTIACRLGSGGTLMRLGYEWSGSSLTKVTDYAAGTRTNEILEDYGNGWWRIGFSFEADNTQGAFELDIDRANAAHTTSIETWGWQLESATGDASYATSYIPTYGSAVTRNQDLASFTHDVATTSWSVFMDVKNWTDVLNSGQFAFSNVADTTNSLFYYSTCFGIQKSVGQQYACGRLSDYEVYDGKFAVTYDGVNTIKIYVDGVLRDTITTADAAKTAGIDGGNLYYAGSASSKEIKSLLVFPTALTDQEAIDLTTI